MPWIVRDAGLHIERTQDESDVDEVRSADSQNAEAGGGPLGFAAKLADAYHAQLRAFLRRNLLVVGLKPAVLRGIVDAGTIQGGPVSFDLTITVHPRNASGFAPWSANW